MHHTELLNALVKKFNYQSYLEIGVQDGKNFAAINCPLKVGVDPDPNSKATIHATSDEFFAGWDGQGFHLVFIDGLHHAEQVERDIKNAIKHLYKTPTMGAIVVHDLNPFTEVMQAVPRETREWTGDGWKAWVNLRKQLDAEMFVVDSDYGMGVIRLGASTPFSTPLPLTYSNLCANRKEWLNLITVDEFKDWLKK